MLILIRKEDKTISLSRPAYYVTEDDIHAICPYGEDHITDVKEDRFLIKICPYESTKNGQLLKVSNFNLYPQSFKNSKEEYEGTNLSILESLEPYMKFKCKHNYGEYSFDSLIQDVRDGLYDTGTTSGYLPDR